MLVEPDKACQDSGVSWLEQKSVVIVRWMGEGEIFWQEHIFCTWYYRCHGTSHQVYTEYLETILEKYFFLHKIN
jgi:hypothetical protein